MIAQVKENIFTEWIKRKNICVGMKQIFDSSVYCVRMNKIVRVD